MVIMHVTCVWHLHPSLFQFKMTLNYLHVALIEDGCFLGMDKGKKGEKKLKRKCGKTEENKGWKPGFSSFIKLRFRKLKRSRT